MLETCCLLSNINYYFMCLETKQFFFSLVPCYYRLLLLKTPNLPQRVSEITGVKCIIIRNHGFGKSVFFAIFSLKIKTSILLQFKI